MEFILLRIQTEIVPNLKPETVAVKFFPVTYDKIHLPHFIFAETAEEAWEQVKKKYPFLSHNFAIEEKTHYDRTVAYLKTLPQGRTERNNKTQSPRT